MSAELATLARAALAGLVFTAAISLATGLAWPLLRRRLARAHPALRARIAWAVAAAPGLLPGLFVALCFAPSALGALGLHADHCARHPEHAHLCFAHPGGGLTLLGAAILALATAALLAAAGREVLALLRARRAIARLAQGATALAPDVSLVRSAAPFSFAAGLLRPSVFVSTALVGSLPKSQLAAVVEHERAHARRRDPLARLAARLLSSGHPPARRRALLAELAVASEQACDAEAALRVGDRLVVAEAILAVERLLAGAPAAPGSGLPAFGDGSIGGRVVELLAPERTPPPRGVGAAPAALAALLALALADPLHHATEHLLGLLARVL